LGRIWLRVRLVGPDPRWVGPVGLSYLFFLFFLFLFFCFLFFYFVLIVFDSNLFNKILYNKYLNREEVQDTLEQ
jgi:hypothetical protein